MPAATGPFSRVPEYLTYPTSVSTAVMFSASMDGRVYAFIAAMGQAL